MSTHHIVTREELDALRAAAVALQEAAVALQGAAQARQGQTESAHIAEMDRSLAMLSAIAGRLERGRRIFAYKILLTVFGVVLLARGLTLLVDPTRSNMLAEGLYAVVFVLIVGGYLVELLPANRKKR